MRGEWCHAQLLSQAIALAASRQEGEHARGSDRPENVLRLRKGRGVVARLEAWEWEAWELVRDRATPYPRVTCVGMRRSRPCADPTAGGWGVAVVAPRTFLNTLVGSNLRCGPSHSLAHHRQHGHVNAKRKKPIAFNCSTSIREHAKTSPPHTARHMHPSVCITLNVTHNALCKTHAQPRASSNRS